MSSWSVSDRPASTCSCPRRAPRSTRIPVRYTRTARHPAVDDLAARASRSNRSTCSTTRATTSTRCTRRSRRVSSKPRTSTARSRTRCRAARRLPSARSCCCASAGIDVDIVPGLSFADLAWNRLGIDPMTGARVVDARAFAVDAAGFARTDAPRAVRHAVRVLRREARVARVAAARTRGDGVAAARAARRVRVHRSRSPRSTASFEPDHLTSLFVDTGEVAVGRGAGPARRADRTVARPGRMPVGRRADASLAAPARARRGVRSRERDRRSFRPTRRAATFRSARTTVLEDELGDLLFQVMIHSVLAAEAGAFTIADVARAGAREARAPASARVRRRAVPTADAVVTNWEQIKKAREGHDVARRGHHARACPSLLYTQKLLRKARVGRARPAGDRSRGAPAPDDERRSGDARSAALAAVAGGVRRHRRRIGPCGVGEPRQGPVRAHGTARGGGRRRPRDRRSGAVVQRFWDRRRRYPRA